MDKIYLLGGQPLRGTVAVGGSKNDTLAILAGTLLVPGKTVLHNVPLLSDVYTLMEIFSHLGAKCGFRKDGALEIDATNLTTSATPHDLVQKMRASFNVLGALLVRFGHASVAMPGGCDIGARPVNYHVRGLEELGCKLHLEHGIYEGEVKRFKGANISLEFPSAGATQHLMMAACRAKGQTVIDNCAAEPEIVSLAAFLNACGAKISGAGTAVITIEGVDELYPTEYSVIPDRMQAGTYALAAAITGGDVMITNCMPEHSRLVIAKLTDAGIDVVTTEHTMHVRRIGKILPTDIKTMPHPGFPTDMQQPFVSLLSLGDGCSVVTETVYENRFRYTTELEKMGANILVEGRSAIIRGVERLTGAAVSCTDLRAGAAVLVAGLAAEGETVIDNLHHLDRGYEDIVPKLRSLGARISRSDGTGATGGLHVCSA
ncbi:MAG: UDP-N-acetylglucosamine 1-carboxyvinyltransferase [Chthonomonadaceae bacterium]|nr:UDP-N-acetylglucosamine 1-carboxyvinyltransferase [Chthonomonadaceae bacterium]